MNSAQPILCPVDFTPVSREAVRLAIEMCRRLGSPLVLHHNLDVGPPGYLSVAWMWSEEHGAEAAASADERTKRLEALFAEVPPGIDCEAKLTRGPLHEVLNRLAALLGARMIVMGTHGPSSAAHSSLTERIVIEAPCPVLTIGESYAPETRVGATAGRSEEPLLLVPIDFSRRSRAVLDFAATLLRQTPCRLELIHVLPATHGPRRRARRRRNAEERLERMGPGTFGGRATTRTAVGHPADCILARAREMGAHFILMAPHVKNAFERLLFGTTSRAALHGSVCPVWFVPPGARRSAAEADRPAPWLEPVRRST